ncbi:MAG: tol-pal system protein YbgF [Betaproteobacteria bacterium]
MDASLTYRWVSAPLGLLLFAGVLFAAMLCASNANAGLFDDDEARRQIKALAEKVDAQNKATEERFTKLDESFKNLGIIQLLNQIELLNTEIARLRGQVEVLANQNEQLQKRQRDFYLDIDTRLRVLEGNTVPSTGQAPSTILGAPTPSSSTPTPAPTPAAGAVSSTVPAATVAPISSAATVVADVAQREKENKAYDVGTSAFRRGDFAAAIRAFNTFHSDYPQSQLAPNALYWTGLCQFNLKDYGQARATQESLLKKYPDSNKAPDAMLVIASVHAEMGDAGAARNSYEDIIAKYSSSDAAAKARMRLSGLRK